MEKRSLAFEEKIINDGDLKRGEKTERLKDFHRITFLILQRNWAPTVAVLNGEI